MNLEELLRKSLTVHKKGLLAFQAEKAPSRKWQGSPKVNSLCRAFRFFHRSHEKISNQCRRRRQVYGLGKSNPFPTKIFAVVKKKFVVTVQPPLYDEAKFL
jgi:hypothetical protein